MKRKKLINVLYIIVFLIAGLVLILSCVNRYQAQTPTALKPVFQGEYRIGDGPWQPIVPGEHIPATKGDVTLRGRYTLMAPDGTEYSPEGRNVTVSLYLNHIGVVVNPDSDNPRIYSTEHPSLGAEACGKQWIFFSLYKAPTEEVVFHLTNHHRYGNEVAVDEFLENAYIYTSVPGPSVYPYGQTPVEIIGLIVLIVAFILIGAAVFSSLMKFRQHMTMWQVGVTVLLGGLCYLLNALHPGIWDDHVARTTTGLLLCSTLYLYCLQALICSALDPICPGLRSVILLLSGLATAACYLLSLTKTFLLYDLIFYWVLFQSVCNLVLLVLCILGTLDIFGVYREKRHRQLLLAAFSLALLAFFADVIATWFGLWQGGLVSRTVFLLLFAFALITVLYTLPKSIQAALSAQKLEAELERSKTAIMLSQIQPHFLFNSLSAIRELCRQDPEEARDALSVFTTYLRGNMDSLKSDRPIHFSKEMSHIDTYLQLEKLRFGEDLSVIYDIQENDFFLPSLIVQPLVENAVKHGVCCKEEGGTVILRTRREGNRIIIVILDNGVGFDPTAVTDQSHVGIRNVRNRLKHMAKGELVIESEPGKGTKATITLEQQ